LVSKDQAVIITDENLFAKHQRKFKGWNTIVLKPGEAYKVQQTVDVIIDQLIAFGADRKTTLIGVRRWSGYRHDRLCGWYIHAWD
jgi:3-dehydroquinate synthase